MRSMDSILSDEPSVHTLPDAQESETQAPEQSATADREESAGETQAEQDQRPVTTQPAMGDDDDGEPDPLDYTAAGLRKALNAERKQKREERRQRQELQRKYEQLAAQMAQQRQAPAPQPQEDPETAYYANPVEWTRRQLEQREAALRTEVAKTRIDVSEAHARRAHADYEEKAAAFAELAQRDPRLLAQLGQEADPGEWAYQMGKIYLFSREVGTDPEAWREKERERLRAELTEQAQAPAKTPPKSIAGVRGSGAGAPRSWSGPRSLDEILG